MSEKVSLVLLLCGDESEETVRTTLVSLVNQQYEALEVLVACAADSDRYRELTAGYSQSAALRFVDLSARDYQTVAQLKNAVIRRCEGEFVSYVQCGEEWGSMRLTELMDCTRKNFSEYLKNVGEENMMPAAAAFSRSAMERYGAFNGELSCGEEYELALRIMSGESAGEHEAAECEDVRILTVGEVDGEPAVYQDMYRMYAYVIGRYSDKLRSMNSFDMAVMRCMQTAQGYGIREYFVEQLTHMVSRDGQYERIEDETNPVLVYMGDPICFDVLTTFAGDFVNELKKHAVPYYVYDMTKKGTKGLASFVGRRFRAVVGFQTALMYVKMKGSGELVNNYIAGPKINFLYDHPLYLYDFLSYPLKDSYMLTQDEDYAEYIDKYYPMIRKSWHLPPAGLELEAGEKPEWQDKRYDLVFVASYHNYRERMVAMEQLEEPYKSLADALLNEMLQHPNQTAELSLANVLASRHMMTEDGEFAQLLSKCMNACRVVMFFYREKIVELLLNAGITLHVFGSSWNNCPLKSCDRLVIHPDVSYREGIEVIAHSRISLNVMSWHKAGMTERVANTMLNNTVCLTDRTTYLDSHFKDGVNIVMFDLERLWELPDKVKRLLDDEELMKSIAAAQYEEASDKHRWVNRVDRFIDMLDNGGFR